MPRPQQRTAPLSARMAQAWLSPALIALDGPPRSTGGNAAGVLVGVLPVSAVLGRPSLPFPLAAKLTFFPAAPQQRTLPSSSSAQVKSKPALIAVAVREAPRSTGGT